MFLTNYKRRFFAIFEHVGRDTVENPAPPFLLKREDRAKSRRAIRRKDGLAYVLPHLLFVNTKGRNNLDVSRLIRAEEVVSIGKGL